MAQDDSTARRVPLGPVGRYVIANLEHLRNARRMTYRQLSERLEQLGRAIPPLGLSRIEKGDRRVDADDLVALALALGVNPSALLLPHGEPGEPLPPSDLIWLTAGQQASLADAWAWADGRGALPGTAAVDFENNARPAWLHRGIIRASELPARIEQLEREVRQLKNIASAPPVAAHLANRPIPVEEALTQPVATAIVTSELGVLVGRRNDGKPPWTFIAGEVEPGESPADAAVREVKEETGLEVQAGNVLGERVHPKTGRTMIYMTATPTRGTDVFVGDEEELAEVRWVSLAELDELVGGAGNVFGPVHEYLEREIGE